jgi:hypothetical protein
VQIAVEDWNPEYGASVDDAVFDEATVTVDEAVEVDPAAWVPRTPPQPASWPTTVFIDGVQRIDAAAWVTTGGTTQLGRFASWAAGAVRCPQQGEAEVLAVMVERGLLCEATGLEPLPTRAGTFKAVTVEPDGVVGLNRALHFRRAALEAAVTQQVADGDALVIADGLLQGGLELTGAVGYVKTHHKAYLAPPGQDVVASLDAGQRTPLFCIQSPRPRLSWYVRLPGRRTHPWAGIVRLEVDGAAGLGEVVALSDVVTALLPRFASQAHKDGRAPQNLYPIAGLERHLRHRLGDREVVVRALRQAAA